jgi:allantoinase
LKPIPHDLLVKNATLVTAHGRARADLAVRAGRISAVGSGLGAAAEVVEAGGLHLLPGLIDLHVHFRDPGLTYKEDFASGTLAAAAGGVTTVHDMPNTLPVVATAEVFRRKLASVAPKAWVDFGLYGVILPDNEADLEPLAAAGAMGFKLYLGQTTGDNPTPDDGVIYGAFRRLAPLGAIVGVHAENNPVLQRLKRELQQAGRTDPLAHLESRPAFVEAEAVERVATIAQAAGGRVHIHHLSTRDGLERAVQARRRGARLTCEALVSHLLLDDSAYQRSGNLVQLNPPIRQPEHVAALWAGLAAGQIDCLATDHAPHSAEEQARQNVWQAHGGFIGVETMLPLLLTQVAAGRLTLERLVGLTSEQPARLYGHYPRKGSLRVGADADFVLVDLQARYRLDQRTLHSKHPVSPFDGWALVGRPIATYLRGRCVVRENQPLGPPGGRWLRPTRGRSGGLR